MKRALAPDPGCRLAEAALYAARRILPARCQPKLWRSILRKPRSLQIPSQYAGIGSTHSSDVIRSRATSEWAMRWNRIESRRQYSATGLVGPRDACVVIPAGVALLQPFSLRVADIATLPHRDQRRHDAEQCRHARFRLPERIAPADRTLRRRGCLAAVDRRVVGGPRWNRSGEQAQYDQTARQFSK